MLPFPIISQTPIQPAKPKIKKLSFNTSGAYLLYDNGELYYRGRNSQGYLGNGTTSNAFDKWYLCNTNVSYINTGTNFGVVMKNDGTYWITGSSNIMNLSGYTAYKWTNCTDKFTAIAPNQGMVSDIVSCVGGLFCLLSTSDLYSLGINTNGALGLGTSTTYSTSSFVKVASNVKTIRSGTNTSCYIDNNHTLYATGLNTNGQLGDGTTSTAISFKSITGGQLTSYPYIHDVSLVNSSTIVIASATSTGDKVLLSCGLASLAGVNVSSGGGYSTYVLSIPSTSSYKIKSISSTMGSANNHIVLTQDGIYGTGNDQYYQLGDNSASTKYVYTKGISPINDINNISNFGASSEGSAFVYSNKIYAAGVTGQWGAIFHTFTLQTDTPY